MRRQSSASTTAPRRVVGYIRISALMGREQGADLLSDAIQREKITSWAAWRDLQIVGWYVDLDLSASKRAKKPRPEFDRMMADAKAGKFETVAVYRLTRFARSVANAASAVDELERDGVTLVSVTEDIDTATVAGTLLRNILFALAEFESERISEEWRNVHAKRRREGIAHVNRMFGYVTNGTVIVDVDEPEAAALRKVFAMRVDGAGTRELQRFLADQGFRSKRSGNPMIAANVVRGMLRNPIYAGLVPQTDGSLVEGAHPAIVSRDVFEAVQATWRRTTALTRTGGRGGSLSGLLICSGCGHPLTSEGRRYRCKAKENGRDCPGPVAVNAVDAEQIVESKFLRRFDPRRMPNQGRVKRTRQQTSWETKARQHRARAEELSRALDALADQAFVKGSLAGDDYIRQQARFLEERARELELATEMETAARTVRPMPTTVLERWEFTNPETRRRALQLLIDRVTVAQAGGRGRYAQPISKRLRVEWLA